MMEEMYHRRPLKTGKSNCKNGRVQVREAGSSASLGMTTKKARAKTKAADSWELAAFVVSVER